MNSLITYAITSLTAQNRDRANDESLINPQNVKDSFEPGVLPGPDFGKCSLLQLRIDIEKLQTNAQEASLPLRIRQYADYAGRITHMALTLSNRFEEGYNGTRIHKGDMEMLVFIFYTSSPLIMQ